MLRVQQVRLCTGSGGQVLHACWKSRLRTGLAQVAQEFGGHNDGTQGEGGETSQEQGLNRPPGGWHRFVLSLFFFEFLRLCGLFFSVGDSVLKGKYWQLQVKSKHVNSIFR